MTRSAGEALDEQQLALGVKCENLLASDAWNHANVRLQTGLTRRLEAITAAGLPPMRIVPAAKLEEIRRLPRSNEKHQVDALEQVTRCGADQDGQPKAVILFYSHRWIRPNWCEHSQSEAPWGSKEREAARAAGWAVGDPDDAEHSKAQILVQYAKWLKAELRNGTLELGDGITRHPDLEIFFWIDFACTNQDDAGPDMATLPAFVGACSAILASWTPEYAMRGWCRVELLMAYAFMAAGDKVLVLPDGFAAERSWRVAKDSVSVADPCLGVLSNPDDLAVVRSLRDVAEKSQSFSCWRTFASYSFAATPFVCFCSNVVCLCQCCGLVPCFLARSVRSDRSTVQRWIPVPQNSMP